MNVTLFVSLLTVFSTVSSLCTEACKKILNEIMVHYTPNVLAFIIACVVGISGTTVYYIVATIEFNAINITCMIMMGFATSIGSMVGYDKVIQTIEQIKNKL